MALRKSYIASMMLVIASTLGNVSCNNEDFSEHIGSSILHPVVSIDAAAVSIDGSVSYNLVYPVPSVSEMSLKITHLQSGKQASWQSIEDYPTDNSFLPGRYFVETAFGDSIIEGIESPYFYASATVDLPDGGDVTLPLVAKLRSCMLRMEFSERFRNYFSSYSTVLHSMGGAYVEYPANERRSAYLHPGIISVQLHLDMPENGREVRFEAAKLPDALPGYSYVASVDMDVAQGGMPVITVSFDGNVQTDDVTTVLSEDFIDAATPIVTCSGFDPTIPVEWIEGTTGTTPLTMSVSEAQLGGAMLSTRCPLLCDQGWPSGIDLLTATAEQLLIMQNLGLKITHENGKLTLDFTDILPLLRYEAGAKSTLFTFEAISDLMKVSSPMTLEIVSLPVELSVVSATDVVAGVNTGEIVVESPTSQLENNIKLQAFVNDKWESMPITEIEPRGTGLYAIRYQAPPGTESLRARVVYCGMTKTEFIINRVSPRYSIMVDAYALKAIVRVIAENEALTPIITSMLRIYGNGTQLQEIESDTQTGTIVIGGLAASTNYSFNATVFTNPTEKDFCEPVNVRTEDLAGFANGSFEDKEKGFEYEDMPSGGRYSQSIIPIFNQQNRHSFDVYVPEKWANTNSKTACKDASYFNTWYVEPSVQIVEDPYAGSYAVMLQSVGWDINGEAIPDYLQPNSNYTQYSCNVPHISHRATGRLFLGDYSFNPYSLTEHYNLGIGFGSRPSALNGFYKFIPSVSDPSDRGAVLVEVLGMDRGVEIVIAKTEIQLRPALSYTAFSVPLAYRHFGIKATKLRVMLASSSHYGSIAEESINVPVGNNLELAAALGSTLWIDELSLSY